MDKGSGKEQAMKIEASSDLSKDDIKKMKGDAKKNADEEKKRQDAVDLRSEADGRAHQSRKQIEELKEKMSDEDRKTLEDKIEELEKALKEDNLEMIKSTNEALTAAWSDVSTRLYQDTGGEPGAEGFDPNPAGGEPQAETESDEDDVETADYEVVDEEEEKK